MEKRLRSDFYFDLALISQRIETVWIRKSSGVLSLTLSVICAVTIGCVYYAGLAQSSNYRGKSGALNYDSVFKNSGLLTIITLSGLILIVFIYAAEKVIFIYNSLGSRIKKESLIVRTLRNKFIASSLTSLFANAVYSFYATEADFRLFYLTPLMILVSLCFIFLYCNYAFLKIGMMSALMRLSCRVIYLLKMNNQ